MFMDAVCYAVPRRARSLSLRSRLVVSRFGRARANDRFSAFNSTFFARSMFGSCRSLARRRRASCAETAMWEGHCCLHGPSHQGSHPRLSPWLRPSANVSRLEAPFCCFMARARTTLNEQCQPSEGEALLNWSNGVEACPPVIGGTPQTTVTRERLGLLQ